MGAAAIALGLLGIFTKGYIFVPLAFICSLVALFLGHVSWAMSPGPSSAYCARRRRPVDLTGAAGR